MVYKISDNILSPLGQTTEENFQQVYRGNSSIQTYIDKWHIAHPFAASLFSDKERESMIVDDMTFFESLAFLSAKKAIDNCSIDIKSPRTLLIMSSTKGNIDLLSAQNATLLDKILLGNSAKKISQRLGLTTTPFTVCNACISGLSAIIFAKRLLEATTYDTAIVVGCEAQSRFIVSGFQSLQALSSEPCRPFDIDRIGLNLGEAASTIILSTQKPDTEHFWSITEEKISQDAYHISTPDKTAKGSCRALKGVTQNIDLEQIAHINLHGTATMYNDQMEAIAIDSTAMLSTPTNALKGYFGHTMGAAGVLETVLTMKALDNEVILGTRGFAELGVSKPIDISNQHKKTDKKSFIKLISGFGGGNATILAEMDKIEIKSTKEQRELKITNRIKISPQAVEIDGELIKTNTSGNELLTEIYKTHIGDYPKFYKMDYLSRLGFIASELLLQAEKESSTDCSKSRAIVFCNCSSSIASDKEFIRSIEEEYPSPSVFIYTLPNIVTGEVAIRQKYNGETSFFILPERDEEMIFQAINTAFADPHIESVLGGFIDYIDENNFQADIFIIKLKKTIKHNGRFGLKTKTTDNQCTKP